MGIYEVKEKTTIEGLFEDWEETLIWSCLQDCMGNAFTDDLGNPQSALIVIGDFCFLAGIPKLQLLGGETVSGKSDFVAEVSPLTCVQGEVKENTFLSLQGKILVPQHEGWSQLIETIYGDHAMRRNRYAIKKEPDIFNVEKLNHIVSCLRTPYELKMIDKELYLQIQTLDWAHDLCSQFDDWGDYEKRGLGAVVLKGGVIVSGASSYTVYRSGIEIEIDTRKDQRRKGLALTCGARLILACLERGLYPSWDAQNPGSAALAEKLGYHVDKTYPVYEIIKPAAPMQE